MPSEGTRHHHTAGVAGFPSLGRPWPRTVDGAGRSPQRVALTRAFATDPCTDWPGGGRPDIPQQYRAGFDMDRLLASLVPAGPDPVAQRLRTTATTLRMSGEANGTDPMFAIPHSAG